MFGGGEESYTPSWDPSASRRCALWSGQRPPTLASRCAWQCHARQYAFATEMSAALTAIAAHALHGKVYAMARSRHVLPYRVHTVSQEVNPGGGSGAFIGGCVACTGVRRAHQRLRGDGRRAGAVGGAPQQGQAHLAGQAGPHCRGWAGA